MGRDIVTVSDVAALKQAVAEADAAAVTGPGGRKLGSVTRRSGPAAAEIPSPDSWNQRLLKFIPGEAVGFYLTLDRAVHSVVSLQGEAHKVQLAIWLFVVLAGSALFNVLYLRFVWRVKRYTQIATSTVALGGYVYAVGGAFEPLGLADPSLQMIVVIVIAAFLIFFKPPGRSLDSETAK